MKMKLLLSVFAILICSSVGEDFFSCGVIPLNIYGIMYTKSREIQVASCDECQEDLCVKAMTYSRLDKICYWNKYRKRCLSGKGLLFLFKYFFQLMYFSPLSL